MKKWMNYLNNLRTVEIQTTLQLEEFLFWFVNYILAMLTVYLFNVICVGGRHIGQHTDTPGVRNFSLKLCSVGGI